MNIVYINQEDWDSKFYKNNYEIWVGPIAGPYMVNADNEQDAIDMLIDWAENHAPGLVQTWDKLTADELEEFICGGNHGLYLTEHEITIKQIRRN